ncbi:MAG: hypothetical protein ACYC1C_01200, partial [Chloroflexota bacterium]
WWTVQATWQPWMVPLVLLLILSPPFAAGILVGKQPHLREGPLAGLHLAAFAGVAASSLFMVANTVIGIAWRALDGGSRALSALQFPGSLLETLFWLVLLSPIGLLFGVAGGIVGRQLIDRSITGWPSGPWTTP